ncbi:MAG: AAA family ATPase [Waddliaceae bacterium]
MIIPTNPFKFGDPVEKEFYLPRPQLENAVSQFLDNRIPVVLIGPRRFGKTSFILNLLKKYDAEAKPYLYIDVLNITSHKDFLHQVLRGLKSKQKWGKTLKSMFQAIAKVRPKISTQVDSSTGQPSFDLSLDMQTPSEKDVKEIIQDVLSELEKLGTGLLFVIDEFQKIAEIGDNGWLEATLRTHMQQLRTTSFLFTGSRRSVISEMLNNPGRPLYRFCQPIEFPAFGDEFTSWIIERFKSVEINCDAGAVYHLRKLVQDTPNYVQMVCFHLVALGINQVANEEVEKALNIVVRQNAYAYQTLLASLTPTQQRTLRLAATEGKQIFAKEHLAKYEISSSPALSSAIKSLKDKEILDEEGASRGTVIFDDPLFAIWLRFKFND